MYLKELSVLRNMSEYKWIDLIKEKARKADSEFYRRMTKDR